MQGLRYYVTDKIDGYYEEDNYFETREEAEEHIRRLEEEDKEEGSYTEGFYAILIKTSPTFL